MVAPPALATAAPAKAVIPPEAFQQGMVVRHPEYGLGKITAIDGQGAKRTATVLFASAAGEKRFYLIHSSLAPAKTG
jgi:DNA helicase-2/ATP-dependent DNA helicase PcrA